MRRDRRGIGSADALVMLSLLSLAFAVVFPRVSSTVRQQEIDAVIQDVESLRAAALAYRNEAGVWPAEAPVGTVPAELVPSLPGNFALEWQQHTLDWSLWETVKEPVVDLTEAVARNLSPDLDTQPPEVEEQPELPGPSLAPLAGISVHTDDEGILAFLLYRYGPGTSFVHGPVWTLILTEGR